MAPTVQDSALETKKLKNKARASLALLLVAVISISTATYAWFSLSNSTSVQSMIVEVSTGVTLKAYAGSTTSTDVTKYFSVIKSEGATGALKAGEIITDALPGTVNGVTIDSLEDVKLWPVTSGNGIKLYTENGNRSTAANPQAGPDRRYYLQLTMTFIADTDMDVYLNGDDSATNAGDGTGVTPNTDGSAADENAIKALRVSFEDTAQNTAVIYEPGWDGTPTPLSGHAKTDGGNAAQQSTFTNLGTNSGRKGNGTESPALFRLEKGKPKEIIIRMWVEGEDAQCLNNDTINIEKAKMNIRLRFSGADKTTGDFIETPAAP